MTKFDEAHLDWLADLLASSATQEIMPRFRHLKRGDVRRKSSAADLVTEADLAAERLIARRLKERYPGALVAGEEACSADPGLLGGLVGAELAFVVDPLDGTYNFASGVPLFGVMLAVVVSGETVAGLVHDPVGGDWLIGVRGGGAFLRSPDRTLVPLRVADPVNVSAMIGSVAWQFMPPPDRALLARNQSKCLSHVGYRCAAHEYRLLASGHAHFAVYNRLMPWDHLAGTLIHGEAGGFAARFDGSRYTPAHIDGGLIAAPDRESWRQLREELWAD